ncbi:hypothetical protein KFK09_022810 [Dendrobium nobile]|uniref:Reverse transcriptase domain-containing protein n=1 Tax=Dendrobium nobile TaxID=94219 RepID=A0A8T3AJT7_DENNO|nr:hypothetical protein KFK09_022810 [Dendrobium nobile]
MKLKKNSMIFFNMKWRRRKYCLDNWPLALKTLIEAYVNHLEAQFSFEEVDLVVKILGNNISPGADGITYSFIKNYWRIIGKDTWLAILHFLETGKLDPKWKEDLVILIPKVMNPIYPSNYYPISLCVSVYKIIAKLLLNRLLKVFHGLISEEQVAFIKGRSLTNHALLAQELFNKMRFSKAKKGLVAIKLDMEQAYDSMAWDTLRKVLKYFGFPTKFSNLLVECVENPEFFIMINGISRMGLKQIVDLDRVVLYLLIYLSYALNSCLTLKATKVGIWESWLFQMVLNLPFIFCG